MKYDCIVLGGGHNGLVYAAYMARAGRKVLVLERRHVLGGAAVTEEVVPGFKFSVCSYVVSLLRPEIIRELDLPRHGLEILPLDGTFTPMPSGDYLWRVNDHARTFREIARHSRVDAEAYDEYGRAMVEMARFVKPILDMTPPDPWSLNPRELARLAFLGRRFRDLPGRRSLQPGAAHDDERDGLSRPVVRDRRAQGDDVGQRHHRHVPGRAFAGHRLRPAAPLHGRDRRRVPVVGTGARRHRRNLRTRLPPRPGRPASRFARRPPPSRSSCATAPRAASCWTTATRLKRAMVASSLDPRRTFLGLVGEDELPDDFVEGVKRYKFRGSSGKVNLALDGLPDFTCLPGAGAHLRGADLDLAGRGLHGARLRRREVRDGTRGIRTSTS